MADDPITPVGTGAVPNPPAAVVTEQTLGHPVSTGAVDGPPPSVTHEFGPSGSENPTGLAENPPAVVTTKVVLAPEPQRQRAGSQAETQPRSHRADTGQVAQQPAQPRPPESEGR